MIDPNLIIIFVWSAMTSGVVGNAAYDGIKAILGKGFDRFAAYAKENKRNEFDVALQSILETNEKIAQQLSELQENPSSLQQQNHYGTGDNIGRDKIVNITLPSTSSSTVKHKLTDKQRSALKILVELARTWQEEFEIVWHPSSEISDIIGFTGNLPNFQKGDILVLEKEGLLICNFLSDTTASIKITYQSYEAVDTNFRETA